MKQFEIDGGFFMPQPSGRRAFLTRGLGGMVASAAALAVLAPPLQAQEAWPARTVKLVHGFAPGGGVDLTARLVAQQLQERLGQTVIVEGRVGAGGMVASGAVAQAAADGYTLYLMASGHSIAPALNPQLPFDAVRDFTMVSVVTRFPFGIAVPAGSPHRTIQDLLSAAKQSPGKYTFGSVGPGTATHLAGEVAALRAGIKLLHVPYKGSVESLTDLVAGRIDLIFDPVALPQVKAGNVKALASTASVRHPDLPDVPTMKEQGIEMPESGWFGVFAPKGTPAEAVTRMATEIERALAGPGTREALLKFGQYPEFRGPDAFAARVRADTVTFRDLIAQAGIKLD